MALTPLVKKTYIARTDPVSSSNLNDIQDAVIELQNKSVITDAQTLTTAKKAQVQENIGLDLKTFDPGVPFNDYLHIYKFGRLVVISATYTGEVTSSEEGWASLYVGLPAAYRPIRTTDFVLYDNLTTTNAENTVIDCRVTNTGNINIYLFADKLAVRPRGTLVYIAAQ